MQNGKDNILNNEKVKGRIREIAGYVARLIPRRLVRFGCHFDEQMNGTVSYLEEGVFPIEWKTADLKVKDRRIGL